MALSLKPSGWFFHSLIIDTRDGRVWRGVRVFGRVVRLGEIKAENGAGRWMALGRHFPPVPFPPSINQ